MQRVSVAIRVQPLESYMRIFSRYILIAGAAMAAGACSDSTTTPATSALARAALLSAPISFDQINTSFVGSSDANAGFVPGFAQGDGQWGRHDNDHEGGPGW